MIARALATKHPRRPTFQVRSINGADIVRLTATCAPDKNAASALAGAVLQVGVSWQDYERKEGQAGPLMRVPART
jgi:hypothetical protein